MAIATLSIDLEARLGRLQAGLDKAGGLAQREAARMDRAFSGLNSTLKVLGGTLAGVLSAGALTAFIGEANRGLLAIKDLSEATGSSVENISALENVARAAGGSIDEVGGILVKFNGALKDAERTKEVGASIRALGLDFTALRDLDPAEALRQVAVALERFEDNGNKARVTQDLFGKSIREAAPYLKELAEQTELSGTVTRNAVLEADKFNKAMAALRQTAEDAARQVGGPLVSAINEFHDVLRGRGPGEIHEYLAVPLQAVSVLGANVAFVLKGIGREIGAIGAQTAALARLDLTGFSAISDAVRADGVAAREELDKLERRLLQLGTAPQASYSHEGRYSAASRPSLALLQDSGTKSGRTGRGPAPVREFVGPELPASLADALQRLERTDTARLAGLRAELESLLSLQRSGVGGDRTAEALADVNEQIDRLNAQRLPANAGLDTSQLARVDFNRSEKNYEAVDAAILRVQDSAKKTGDIGAELGLTFASAFEDAIVQGGNLRNVLGGLEKDIVRIITRRMVTEPLDKAITGFLQPASAGGGGGFDLGGLFGKIIGGLFGGGFADGGYLPAGRWGIAGERGPEPIFGGRTGKTIVPNHAARAVVVNQQFHLSGPADMRTQQQISAAAGRGVQQAMARNL